MKTEIPDFLQHLPVQRGYPVPFFAPFVDGVYDLHLADARKQYESLTKHLCHICGKKIPTATRFYISGPEGLKNKVSTDTWMHEHCARFSLEACPHLAIQKAERRKLNDDPRIKKADFVDLDKPDCICLIKSDKYEIIVVQRAYVINYRPIAYQRFDYVNGRLQQTDKEWQKTNPYEQWRKGGVYPKANLL